MANNLLLNTSNQVLWNGSQIKVDVAVPTPSYVTDQLKLFVDAGDPTSYSGGSTWTDISGNGNHMTLNGTYTSDSISIDFGNTGTATRNAIDLGQAYSFFMILYPYGTFRTKHFDNWNANKGFILLYRSDWYGIESGQDAWLNLEQSPPFNAWRQVGFGLTSGAMSGGYLYSNGTRFNGTYGGGPTFPIVPNPFEWTGTFGVGQDENGGTLSNGKVGAVMLYGKELSDAEVQLNYNYFKTRYSLP